jgi:hypothetical protein
LLDLQRQMLQAWAAPWMALGMPGLGLPDAARARSHRPAPAHGTAPVPTHVPASHPAPAARQPAPAEDLPWSPGTTAPVAVMGAQAAVEATPRPQAPPAEPRPGPAHHTDAEANAPARRPRKMSKVPSPLRAAPSRKAAGRLAEDRSPATSGRRITKPSRKPTH